MSNSGNNYITVVDIESTCWIKGQVPDGQYSEIIEIGYCLFNYQHNLVGEKGSIIIRPQHSKVSNFCTQLTGWTQEVLDKNGITFQEACNRLVTELDTSNKSWASYGDYDRRMIEDMCQIYGVEYPFSPQHLNIKAMLTALSGKKRGLGGALNALKLQFEGTRHRGVDDAYNTARILQYLTSKVRKDLLHERNT